MVLSYSRPTGHLLKWFKGKGGTNIEMYGMYVKSFKNNYVLDWVTYSSTIISIDRYVKHGY